ncbi:MAG: hypothetical protein M3Q82_09735 [Actinomycetota bacterium]|nr:hypothetical protein [Actinomycetota bacterium]
MEQLSVVTQVWPKGQRKVIRAGTVTSEGTVYTVRDEHGDVIATLNRADDQFIVTTSRRE